MIRTRVCDILGIEHPILSAPMGPNLSDIELTAAVSGAGGMGILQAQLCSPEAMRAKLHELRSLTDRPFGVNFIMHFPHEPLVEVCLEEEVPLISFFWGDPSHLVSRCHTAGAKVMLQVGSRAEARRAAESGVDLVVAQGIEAGGHVAGQVGTMALVPRIVDAVSPSPVIAAGGISDARGVVAALALGAEGVALGTRFLASAEANAHETYRVRLVVAGEDDTVLTTLFGQEWPDAPHRVLRTALVEEWLDRDGSEAARNPEQPLIGETRVAGQQIPLRRFMGFPPCADATGEVEAMSLLAGQGVGLVNEVRPAAEIVRDLVAGAETLIGQRLAQIAALHATKRAPGASLEQTVST